MQEEDGAISTNILRLWVQVQVNKAMKKLTGLLLKMERSSMTSKGKLLWIPKIELLCDTRAGTGRLYE